MAQTNALTAEKIRHYENEDGEYVVHIRVDEAGEWVGDFWVTFRQRRAGDYVADWSNVWDGGDGEYYEGDAPFWPVEEVAEEMGSEIFGVEFTAINSDPDDW